MNVLNIALVAISCVIIQLVDIFVHVSLDLDSVVTTEHVLV